MRGGCSRTVDELAVGRHRHHGHAVGLDGLGRAAKHVLGCGRVGAEAPAPPQGGGCLRRQTHAAEPPHADSRAVRRPGDVAAGSVLAAALSIDEPAAGLRTDLRLVANSRYYFKIQACLAINEGDSGLLN